MVDVNTPAGREPGILEKRCSVFNGVSAYRKNTNLLRMANDDDDDDSRRIATQRAAWASQLSRQEQSPPEDPRMIDENIDDLSEGFKFCPTDEVLVFYYLRKKLNGELTRFQINEVDVYSIEPWKLFNGQIRNDKFDDDDDSEDDEPTCHTNLIYVFTKIKKKHKTGERIDRTVTTSLSSSSSQIVIGTWKGQKVQTKIKDKKFKKIVGAKKSLSFIAAPKQDLDEDDPEDRRNNKKRRNDDQLDGASYIMHEYSMTGSSYVLCKIRRKIDKKRKKLKCCSCSRNYTRKNTCENDQDQIIEDQLLPGRMTFDDDHHQILMNASPVLDHNQSMMSSPVSTTLLQVSKDLLDHGHKGVKAEQEDLSSQQQQQQSPAPSVSVQEVNLLPSTPDSHQIGDSPIVDISIVREDLSSQQQQSQEVNLLPSSSHFHQFGNLSSPAVGNFNSDPKTSLSPFHDLDELLLSDIWLNFQIDNSDQIS